MIRVSDEDYVFRWVRDYFDDDVEEYRFSLRGAMLWAERFRYGVEQDHYRRAHPRRAILAWLVGLQRLRDAGFELWLKNEYGDEERTEEFERLLTSEILKRHSLEARTLTSE